MLDPHAQYGAGGPPGPPPGISSSDGGDMNMMYRGDPHYTAKYQPPPMNKGYITQE